MKNFMQATSETWFASFDGPGNTRFLCMLISLTFTDFCNVCLIKSYFKKHQKSFKTILNNLFCIWYIGSVMLDRWFEYNSNYYFQCFIILMLSDSIIRSCNISKWPDTYCISEIRLCLALFIPVCVNINNSI